MTDPVPAPEQQGDGPRDGWLSRQAKKLEQQAAHVPTEYIGVPRPKPEEQQGEPVCARCGETFSPSAAYPGYHWRYIQIGERSENRLCGPFEPAPPSSEEAEARRSNKRPPPLPLELLFPGNLRGERRAYVEGWIEGRSPLEERVRDLRRWAEIDHANLEALEEERDRLRGLLQSMHAAGEVDGRNALIARAEAAEAQVAKLRERLRRIRTMAAPAGADYGDAAIVCEVDDALAETVQEGGETQ